jgi:pimeloyl-ACP methyl ester carboxylesterase
MTGPDFLEPAPGRRLAFRRREGRGPCLIFLPGYRSDMEGSKASALDAWAAREGRALLRFDYAGCGASSGDFEAQTLDGWLGDALAMVDSVESRVVLVGSSMGGWIMLLAALARPERVAALVGIAVAPDFTSWGYSQRTKDILRAEGRLETPSQDGAQRVTTRAFWESGERLKLLGARIPIHCPVRLLHGLSDCDVPWRIALETMERIEAEDVQAQLIKDGDHRLSREGDIARLLAAIGALPEDEGAGPA